MVENIHQTEEADESPISHIFDYFADDCFCLEEDTKELLRKSIVASAGAFTDDDDDDDDDETKVKRFLKALAKLSPGPNKDYDDLAQENDERPDRYGNRFSGKVKVLDRKSNRYCRGPNEDTLVGILEFRRYAEKMAPGQNSTAAQASLHPNTKPGYSHGLSMVHHAVSDLRQYCDNNDITAHHL